MQEPNNHQAPLHVLNDYLKFEKKIYQVFGVPLGRPIAFKAVGYFLLIFLLEMLLYVTPIIGSVLHAFPFVILIAIPIALAYLLADVQTEGRSSMVFFRSVILYQFRKQKKVTYIRDRELPKPAIHHLGGYSVITSTQSEQDKLHYRQLLKQNARAKRLRKKKLKQKRA